METNWLCKDIRLIVLCRNITGAPSGILTYRIVQQCSPATYRCVGPAYLLLRPISLRCSIIIPFGVLSHRMSIDWSPCIYSNENSNAPKIGWRPLAESLNTRPLMTSHQSPILSVELLRLIWTLRCRMCFQLGLTSWKKEWQQNIDVVNEE